MQWRLGVKTLGLENETPNKGVNSTTLNEQFSPKYKDCLFNYILRP